METVSLMIQVNGGIEMAMVSEMRSMEPMVITVQMCLELQSRMRPMDV